MTDEQRFLTTLAALAKTCSFSLTPELIEFYDEGLSGLGYGPVSNAIKEILLNRRAHERFPSIRDIRDRLEPTSTIDGATQELLTRVISAIPEFGYNDPEGARRFMGEIAWEALPGAYGWSEFCCADIPISSARAQLRDRIAALLRSKNPSGTVQLLPPDRTPRPALLIHQVEETKLPIAAVRELIDQALERKNE